MASAAAIATTQRGAVERRPRAGGDRLQPRGDQDRGRGQHREQPRDRAGQGRRDRRERRPAAAGGAAGPASRQQPERQAEGERDPPAVQRDGRRRGRTRAAPTQARSPYARTAIAANANAAATAQIAAEQLRAEPGARAAGRAGCSRGWCGRRTRRRCRSPSRSDPRGRRGTSAPRGPASAAARGDRRRSARPRRSLRARMTPVSRWGGRAAAAHIESYPLAYSRRICLPFSLVPSSRSRAFSA